MMCGDTENLTNLMLRPIANPAAESEDTLSGSRFKKRSSRRATCAFVPGAGGAPALGRPLVTLSELSDTPSEGSSERAASPLSSQEAQVPGEDAAVTSARAASPPLDEISSARLAFLENERKSLKAELEESRAALEREREALEASEAECSGLQASVAEAEARLQEWKTADDELDDDCTVRIELRTSLEAQEAELKRLRPLEAEVETLRNELSAGNEELATLKARLEAESARADEAAEAAALAANAAEEIDASAKADLDASAAEVARLSAVCDETKVALKASSDASASLEEQVNTLEDKLARANADAVEANARAESAEASLKSFQEATELEGDAAGNALRQALRQVDTERERADAAEGELEGLHDELVELREAACARRSDGANVIAELSASGELARIEAAKARESVAMLEEKLDAAMQGRAEERQARLRAEEKLEDPARAAGALVVAVHGPAGWGRRSCVWMRSAWRSATCNSAQVAVRPSRSPAW